MGVALDLHRLRGKSGGAFCAPGEREYRHPRADRGNARQHDELIGRTRASARARLCTGERERIVDEVAEDGRPHAARDEGDGAQVETECSRGAPVNPLAV